ncbi:MAG: hypothetical protein LC685_04395 [Actinobacteria bacterium]|nr:hypothetical protein [Actinomycetota bacterium]
MRFTRPLAATLILAALTAGIASGDDLNAETWWQANRAQILAGFRNGQCTDFAAFRRPDVIEEVDEHVYAQWVQAGTGPHSRTGMSRSWCGSDRTAGSSSAKSTPPAYGMSPPARSPPGKPARSTAIRASRSSTTRSPEC